MPTTALVVTLDRLLGDLDTRRRHLRSRHVVIVDEAGMVGTRHLDRVTTDIARAYRDHDRVEDHTDIDTVINRWAAARSRGADVLLLAGRRDQVSALNRAARARLKAAGELEPDRCILGGRPYAIGDHVVTLRNDHHLGVLNGTRGVITHVDDGRLAIELYDGRQVAVPHAYAEAGWVDHGYALTIHKAQGVTADETITLADDTLAREHAYVALSRGRLSNRFIVAITDGFNEHERGRRPLDRQEGGSRQVGPRRSQARRACARGLRDICCSSKSQRTISIALQSTTNAED